MSNFLLSAAIGVLMIGGESATAARKVQTPNKKAQGKNQGRVVGEQDLHLALKHTHAAAKEEKAQNGKGALADAQAAIQALHAAAKAFDSQHKKAGGKAGTHHHLHPHIHAAIKDLTAAEKTLVAGHVGKSEKDLHKAGVQIQDAIQAHHLHQKKK